MNLAYGISLSRNSIDLFKSDSESECESWGLSSDEDDIISRKNASLSDTTDQIRPDSVIPFSALHKDVKECVDLEFRSSLKKRISILNVPTSKMVITEIENFMIKVK